MPSKVCLPPVECCRGTSPSHAGHIAGAFEPGVSPIAAMIAVAPSGPIPGIVMRRRARSSASAISFISLEIRSNALFQPHEVLVELLQYRDWQTRCQVIVLVINHAQNIDLEDAGAPADRNTMLQAVGSHLADQVRAVGQPSRLRMRCNICRSTWSASLMPTKRIVGRSPLPRLLQRR
jgi:hypothetical protein